jgi:LuxR family transcriptional regulator, maltose regulon positive regulatory protein
MSRSTPTVADGVLFDPARPDRLIRLDSPAWRTWLEAPTTTGFAYPLFDPAVGYSLGVMTVRKERRQRGGSYWLAYRRLGGRLCKVYLGGAPAVTAPRLQAIADAFRAAAAATRPLDHAARKEGSDGRYRPSDATEAVMPDDRPPVGRDRQD